MPQTFFPRLSSLIGTNQLPDIFTEISQNLQGLIDGVRYKSFDIQKLDTDDGVYCSLTLIYEDTYELGVFGSGLKLVLNPPPPGSTQATQSEFGVTLLFRVGILGIDSAFDWAGFNFTGQEILNLIRNYFNPTDKEILFAIIYGVIAETVETANPIDFVKEFIANANENVPNCNISLTVQEDVTFGDILTAIGTSNVSITDILTYYLVTEPGNIDKVAPMLLSAPSFSSALSQLMSANIVAQVNGLPIAISFPESLLKPVDDNNNVKPGQSMLRFGYTRLRFSTNHGYEIGGTNAFSLDRSQIGDTGFILSLDDAKIDLSKTVNIPEATADGRPASFKGMFIGNATIEFPKDFQDGADPKNPSLVGKDILVGTEGGLSGTIELNGAGALKFDIFGIQLELNQFSITFKQNSVSGGTVTGWMRIPQLEDTAGNKVVLNVTVEFSSKGYSILFEEPEAIPVKIKGLLTIKLFKLKIGKENDNFFLEVKADGEREFSIPFVDKVLPIGVLVDTLRFEEGQPTTANVYPRWEGPVPVTFTDNGVKVRLDINKEFFKILKVNYLDIGVETITDGIDAELLFNGSLKVGPLVATAGGLGLSTNIVKTDGKGNIGPFDVNAAFVPPSEIGLSVKTKAVTGGGYLWLDPDSGNYAGAIELSFKDKFDLKAIGILSTKLPDGQKGFSLLIIVTAKFSPVQLGFGFTLSGVGGLLGLHRTVNKEELKLGVRDNKLDNILFPENVVENASTIISQMQTVFPIRKGQFVIGPMGLIGWGAPVSLIDAELGVIIEVPNPVMVAIVGVVKIALPDKDAPIALLQINFAGIIDFENKMFSFDASLYKSRILTFALTGDMALRIKWGDKPDFGFAIGGFHPDYEVPTALGFPEMRRLTLSLFDTALLRVNLETYFAVTSNTVQTGAKLDAFAGAGEFYAEAILYYDVLLQFNPFRLTADMGAMVGIKMGKKTILSALLDLHVEGPKPWYLEGEVEFRFLGINYSIDFKETIGEEQQVKQVASIDAWTKLKDALEHKSNWQAIQPPANSQLVSLKDEGKEASALMVHPFGTLAFKQSVLPFDFELEKFGNGKPKDYKKYKISSVEDAASNTYATADELEFFAPAEYIKMSDDDKLGRDSFQQFKGGARLSGTTERHTDHYARKLIAYEKKVVDESNPGDDPWNMPSGAFDFEIMLASASVSPASATANQKPSDGPDAVAVEIPKYKVKLIDDLSDFTTNEFENEWAAMQYIQQQESANPALEQTLTVLSTFEEE